MVENVKFELLQADDYARYVLSSKTDIAYYLRGMKDKGSNLSIYYGSGNDFFLTAVLDIDESGERLILDMPRDASRMRAALEARDILCVTSLDRVKVQFSVNGLQPVDFEGSPALSCVLPQRMLRLQRRDYYRLIAPEHPPLRCLIQTESGPMIEAKVVDISGGGLAVLATPTQLRFDVENQLDHCQITLPEIGAITASLIVRNVFQVTEKSGVQLRAGCQFVGLPATASTLIQRYIMKMERERHQRQHPSTEPLPP